jgi:hypothetical protein
MRRTNFELYELLPDHRTKLIDRWDLMSVPDPDVEPIGWFRQDVRRLMPVYAELERANERESIRPRDYQTDALVQWKDYGRVGAYEHLVSGPLYACEPDAVQRIFGSCFVPNPRYEKGTDAADGDTPAVGNRACR